MRIYAICSTIIAWQLRFSPAELAARNARGQISTTYTACPDVRPNLFSNNAPADAAYIPLYCIANGFSGYLHWSCFNWPYRPLQDTRYRMFSPGDTYMLYPGGRSSVRFERLIEGIQMSEKVRLLRSEYATSGNTEALSRLNDALQRFSLGKLSDDGESAVAVSALQKIIDEAE